MLVLCGFLTLITPLHSAEVRDIPERGPFLTPTVKATEDQCTKGKEFKAKYFKFEHHFHFPSVDRRKWAIMQSVSEVCRAGASGRRPLHDDAAAFYSETGWWKINTANCCRANRGRREARSSLDLAVCITQKCFVWIWSSWWRAMVAKLSFKSINLWVFFLKE